MPRNYVLYFVFFLIHSICLSQNQYNYVGAIKPGESLMFSYKISFIENAGRISGYSITDIGGEDETRSNIIGTYDKKTKTLSFQETGVLYTKSEIIRDSFCNIHSTIKPVSFEKDNRIKGDFVALFPNGTEYAKGKLILGRLEKIEARLNKVAKKINRSKRIDDSVKQRVNPLKLMDSLNMNILRKNQTLSVFTKANKMEITIYDGGKEDGDKITINSNGKPILQNYETNNSKKIITVELIDKKTSIEIKALNEGKIAPNTVVVKINDGAHEIRALSNLKRNETTRIDILKR